MKNNPASPSGIVLLAKQAGRTSFSSLSVIKKALETTKVGHTGTLDSFADGLLVVLSNKLTRLVPAITDFDKEYLALVEFGSETDTLDPTGNVIKTGKIPSKEEVLAVLPQFTGQIMQKPPVFSALHVDGKRASDLARAGKTVEIPARPIAIYALELVDFKDRYALLRIECSKGTYIRCLGRDIAEACGSCAHLKALRRTRVGPFYLKDATGYSNLGNFTIDGILNGNLENIPDRQDEIKNNVKKMDPQLADFCGFKTVTVKDEFVEHFYNGRPPAFKIFNFKEHLDKECKVAVFMPDGTFGGVLEFSQGRLNYVFIIPRDETIVQQNAAQKANAMKVFDWKSVKGSGLKTYFAGKKTALTVGSFDGPHIGHQAIFDSVVSSGCDLKGIVTFTKSMTGIKKGSGYGGDISTIDEKIKVFRKCGFDFAVVIEFNEDFGATSGEEFFSILKNNCNLSFLAEGRDFKCGYKGSFDINCIEDFCNKNAVELKIIDDILYEGERISSSRIRQLIQEGNFEKVEKMLGRKISSLSIFKTL